MNVFVTTASAKRMEMGFDPEKAKMLYLDDLYELSLWVFSRPERRWLAAARMFYQNTEFYIRNIYSNMGPRYAEEDDLVFVDRGSAYHFDSSCEKLRADYRNFTIPVEIVHRGEEEKKKFRAWFVENQPFSVSSEKFIDKMTARFLLKNPPHIEGFQKENSGVAVESNPSIKEIKDRIDKNLAEMKIMKNRNSKLISQYGWQTHRVRNGDIETNGSENREILYLWHDSKAMLKKDLKTYFRVRFNPDLEFRGDLLQSIGFKPCKSCCSG